MRRFPKPRGFYFPRFLSALLSATLCFQAAAPAYALRQPSVVEADQKTRSGLEEALTDTPPAVMGIAAIPEGGALEDLRQARDALADLSPLLVPTVRIWAELDFLLNAPEPDTLPPDTVEEYRSTRRWLGRFFPSASQVTLRTLTANNKGLSSFEVTTPADRYVLSVRTQSIPTGEGYSEPPVVLTGLPDEAEFRLEDINTGVIFPWEVDVAYPGSYLNGTTDRWRNAEGIERWAIKPGARKGDAQFFRLIPAQLTPNRLEALLTPPRPIDSAQIQTFRRSDGNRQHHFLTGDLVFADVFTSPSRTGRGQVLTVAFPSRNAGFYLHDPSAPAPYQLEGVEAVTRGTDQRGVRFRVRTPSAVMLLPRSRILLDSVRAIREEDSRFDNGARGVMLKEFAESVHALPRDIQEQLRDGISLDEIRLKAQPVVRHAKNGVDQRLYIFRRTIDGHLYLAELIFPSSTRIEMDAENIRISSGGGEPLVWEGVVTSAAPPLHVMPHEELFTREALEWGTRDPKFRHRLEEVSFLFSQEFVAAGSHRFLQFFSRDTLVWLRLFSQALTPQAHQRVLQGILDRISPEGRLPTVGEVGDQVSFELIESFCLACRDARITGNYREVVNAGRALQDYAAGKGPVEHLKYGVPDVDYLFLPAFLDFLRRPDVTPEQKAQFLQSSSRSGVGNITALFHNLERVIQRAQGYWDSQSQRRHWLTALATIENPQKPEGYGNWRDVEYGLGGGIYPSDVNRELIPLALDSSREIFKNLAELPLEEPVRQELQAAVARASRVDLGVLLAAWRGLSGRFSLELPPEQIKLRLTEYLKSKVVTSAEREWFLGQPLGHGITVRDFTRGGDIPPVLADGISYFPVSLNAQGSPVGVISNDTIVGLFDPSLDPGRLVEILTPLLLPYPVGLLTPAGVLSASPAFSTDTKQWYEITNRAYGGSVIYGWQTEYLREGLIRQIQRFAATPKLAAEHRKLLSVLYSALYVCCEKPLLEEAAGEELRTWRVDDSGRFRTVFFGGPNDNDETNVIQLWNESATILHSGRLDQIAREQGLQRMEEGVLLDALARVREQYPVQRIPEVRPNPLPRVGIVSYSALGGGGVNIVVEDQYTMLRLAGYPVKLMIGQSLSKERGEQTARDLGINLQIIPELDVKGEIESFFRDHPGQQPHDFRSRVEDLKARLRQEFQDLDVVLIHQAMALFGNPILTVALDELAREPGVMGRVRFISWIHNVDPSSAQVGWPKSILAQHPLMEAVAVSPQEGRRAAQLYGVDTTLVGTVGNGRSAITWGDFSPKTLKFFLDHRLQESDVICFYPSRMEPTKNLEAAIWAVYEAVTYQHLDVRFVIATTAFLGPDGEEHLPSGGREGEYLNTLRGLIHSLGLSDRVLIYPHTGNPKEIRTWYQLSDLHLFTSQTETFGITILEAMLLGKPFIRVDLPETSRLTGGNDYLTFPKQKFGEPTEGYGKWIGLEMARFFRDNPALLKSSRLQKDALARNSTEAVFFGLVDPLLRVPVPSGRSIRVGARNFPHGWDYPHGGGSVQQAMRQTADGGYFGFEVAFEGFTPGDFMADPRAVEEVRRIAQERGLRLSLRLPDISRMNLSDPETEAKARTILQDAVRFALQTHALEITVKLNRLDEKSRDLLTGIASQFLPAEQKRMHESLPPILMAVENVTGADDQVLTPEALNRAFEGTPVGVSLWFDRLEDPKGYTMAVHLKLANVYLGGVFWSQSDSVKVDRLGGFLNWLQLNHWAGSVLSQKPSQGPGDFMGERLVLDHVVTTAYMPAAAVKALQTGDILNPPVIPAILTDSRAGLEETVLGAMESAYQTHSVSDLVLGVRQAANLRQPVAVLFDPRLVPGGSAAERQVNLIGLAGPLKAAFAWPAGVPLELGLLSERAGLEERGFRIIEVVPHLESLNAALPQAALPVVVAEALAAAGNRFLVNVGSYSGLEEVTLPDILGVLTNRFA